ncbi:hypothetical protein RYX36_016929, partial [Vicia faba]
MAPKILLPTRTFSQNPSRQNTVLSSLSESVLDLPFSIADHSLAHHALVHNSSIFSDRPKALPTGKLMSSNQHNISSASYGATWRTLRRNLASEMLHPAKVKSFSEIRNWVLDTLINRLKTTLESKSFMAYSTVGTLDYMAPEVLLKKGPLLIPILTSLLWLRKSFSQLEPFLKNLHAKHGPIIALRIGSRPSVFITDHSLAHHALVHNSSIFSDCPKALPTGKLMSSNQHNISSASYGATWRTLRRNLASEMLHPVKVKSFSEIRNWVLDTLINRLKTASESESFMVVPHFHYAMFCLLVFMCFGERVSDEKVNEIER